MRVLRHELANADHGAWCHRVLALASVVQDHAGRVSRYVLDVAPTRLIVEKYFSITNEPAMHIH